MLISACDTFRSGAVEQLQTHARCLNVELFSKGYDKDPSHVAQEAVKYAARSGTSVACLFLFPHCSSVFSWNFVVCFVSGFDVVCVDTAGRMQDNEPLMRALAKLTSENNPDLVNLFQPISFTLL